VPAPIRTQARLGVNERVQRPPRPAWLTPIRVEMAVVAGGVIGGLLYALGAVLNPFHATFTWQVVYVPIGVLVGWSFLFAGLVAARRRPSNPTGLLMSLVGLAWFASDIGWIPTPLTMSIYLVFNSAYLALLGHLCLSARPPPRSPGMDCRSSLGVYAWWFVASMSTRLTDRLTLDCTTCPPNPLYAGGSPALHNAVVGVSAVITASYAVLILVLVVRHWMQASPPARRVLAPAIWSVVPIVLVELAAQLDNLGLVPSAVEELIRPAELAIMAVLPAALLIGVLRTRLGRAAVSDLVIELGRPSKPGSLRDSLARVLGDPSLELALAMPGGGFVDSQGAAVVLPESGSPRAVTMIATDGDPVAALVHDPVLEEEDPGLVAAAGSAAKLSLENERLQAKLRATLEEVRASRARIMDAADAERRRLERDIHDGAQQRLVALALELRLSRERATALGDAGLAAGLDEASSQLKRALSELRDLARGIHPAVLTRAGIGPALRSLAEMSPVPVEILEAPSGRYPEAVEAAVYFCVSEALVNAAKHSNAGRVVVSVSQQGVILALRIVDDGVGGADSGLGTGMVGMADRLAVLGGQIRFSSPPGKGTTVTAEIPCG
jgi:signal transduction histidine kinase